jgi:uncharacterized membrane protein YkoI
MPYEYLIPLLILLGVIIYAAITASLESKQQVPMAVYEAFYKAYPQARDVTFEKDRKAGKTVFEVEFEDQGVKTEVTCATDGTLLEIEEDIKPEALPAAVTEALKKAYPNATLKKVEKVTRTDGTVSGYEVEIKQELEIHLDASGNILKTEAE